MARRKKKTKKTKCLRWAKKKNPRTGKKRCLKRAKR